MTAPSDVLVPATRAGIRLDVALAELVPGLSRRAARRLVADGAVFVDDHRVRVASRPLHAGARIRVARERPRDAVEIVVLFDHPPYLVVDKPCGAATSPTATSARGSVEHHLKEWLRAAGRPFAHVAAAHRLDVETSGALLFTTTAEAAERARAAFAAGTVERLYLAAVRGRPPADRFTLDAPLKDVGRRVVAASDGRPARTDVVVACANDDGALLVVLPRTGRRHQIRVHLADRGLPLVGDGRYGPSRSAGAFGLHAHALALPIVVDGTPLAATSAPPPSFLAAAQAVGLADELPTLLAAARAERQTVPSPS